MDLKGKVAIVTGGSSGIGRAIALAFGKAGASVIVDHLHDVEGARAVVDGIEHGGGRAQGVEGDVSSVHGIDALLQACERTFGIPDILVNNAGIETHSSLLKCTEAEYDRVLATDLKGPLFCMQRTARAMVAAGREGRIINISSVHEEQPMPGNIAYCCAKGGMRMLTRTAGVELAPHGISVVGIAPGAVDTPINAHTMQDPALLAELVRSIPAGRIARPEEIADLALWLAAKASPYLTATTIFLDGGLTRSSTGL